MPMSPGDYLQKYKSIAVDGVLGRQNVELTGYRSSFKGDENTKQARKRTYYDLRNFILKRKRYAGGANGASHSWSASGTLNSDLLQPVPHVQVNIEMLQAMFQGVGRPADFKALLRVIDVYLTRAEIDEDHFSYLGWSKFKWLDVPWDIQQFADALLGIDCRGFVGAYLNENQPHIRDTKKDMSFSIDSYNKGPASFHKNKKGGQFIRIDDPDEIRSGDIMIKCSDGGSRHVALIDKVGMAKGNRIWIKTAESRGSTGLAPRTGDLIRLHSKHQDGQNDRNWQHDGAKYNFVLRVR